MELAARLFTPDAGEYLAGLVGLWEHTYPVRHDALTAEISLTEVQLAMTADEESLSLRLVGDDPDRVCAARVVVERHLNRVGAERDEHPHPVDWQDKAVHPSSGLIS
jgi:hypothetical protein